LLSLSEVVDGFVDTNPAETLVQADGGGVLRHDIQKKIASFRLGELVDGLEEESSGSAPSRFRVDEEST